jgi:hypothetical protein
MKTKNAARRSPKIEIIITKENYHRAIRASSGGCLVADAIKQQYPQFTNVEVGTQSTRVTDKERGERYIYLTPRIVGEALLYFDQGWTEDELSFPKQFVFKKAVQILPIVSGGRKVLEARAKHRAARLAELEAKEKREEPLTNGEKAALTRMRTRKEPAKRPAKYGPAKVEAAGGTDIVIRGGTPPINPRYNPNLLHGRNRHFGAKTARPSEVFEQAVQQAMKERLEEAAPKEEDEAAVVEEVAAS